MQQPNIKNSQDMYTLAQSNTFSMKRVAITNAPPVVVDFTPITTQIIYKQIDSQKQLLKSHPILNNDGHYFTPTFMLHQDKIRVEASLQFFKDTHQNKLIQLAEEKEQCFVPMPSKHNSFCCVCKSHYDDYLTHLNMPNHVQASNKNKFWKDINKLCKGFNKKLTKRGRPKKEKTIKKDKKEVAYNIKEKQQIKIQKETSQSEMAEECF